MYAFAIAHGREIVIDKHSAIAHACEILEFCGYRTTQDAFYDKSPILFKRASLEHASSLKPMKLHDFISYSKGKNVNHIDDVLLRAAGFMEDISWWSHNKSFVYCVSNITDCGLYTFACVAKKSLQLLFSGPFKDEYINCNASFTDII